LAFARRHDRQPGGHGVLFWAVVLRDHPPRQAWLAFGLFVVSPAAVYSLADHYLVDPLAYAFLAGVLFLLHRDRLTLAAVLCVAGLLDKEPVLFAAPIVFLLVDLAPRARQVRSRRVSRDAG
jgi:hypothetical protein